MLEELAGILAGQARSDGSSPTAIDGVHAFRANGPSPLRCLVYQACVIIVAQGVKRARVGEVDFDYSPSRYLVLPVALPIDAQILEASQERPFLSMMIGIDPVMLAELVTAIEPGGPRPGGALRGIAVSEMTDEILEATLRLLSCLGSALDCRVLAPQIKREILYRVLLGPQGELLRGVGDRDSRLGQVSRALQLIHAGYDQRIEITALARESHMSTSTFHEVFKSVTSQTPLQYLKEIRLRRARQIMVWEGATASLAASRVGYGSASQFSREFKRRFGRTPGEERAWADETGERQGGRPY